LESLQIFLLAAVPFADRYRYVVDAANAISAAYYQPGSPSNADIQQMAHVACDAFTRLSTKANFRGGLTQLARRRPGYQRQIEDLRNNLSPIITKFLAVGKISCLTARSLLLAGSTIILPHRR
jgi:hypothetical protein